MTTGSTSSRARASGDRGAIVPERSPDGGRGGHRRLRGLEHPKPGEGAPDDVAVGDRDPVRRVREELELGVGDQLRQPLAADEGHEHVFVRPHDDGGNVELAEPEARRVQRDGGDLPEERERGDLLFAERGGPFVHKGARVVEVVLREEDAREELPPAAREEGHGEERRERSDAREPAVREPRRRREKDEPVDPARVPEGDVLRDHPAHRDADDRRAPHPRRVHRRDHVRCHLRHSIRRARLVALAGATVVEDEDAPRSLGVAGEELWLLEPESGREREAVDEHDVLVPSPHHLVVNPHAPRPDRKRHGAGMARNRSSRVVPRIAGDGKGMISSPDMTESRDLRVHVERVLPPRADLTVGEVDAMLEAAYLATAADGVLSSEENEAFRYVASALRHVAAGASGRAKPIGDKDLNLLFERFAVRSDHAARLDRLAAMRARLGRTEVRELAYKVAFAMSLCDLDANDDETAYDDELVEVFGIEGERADALAAEVYAALDADLDRDSEAPPR